MDSKNLVAVVVCVLAIAAGLAVGDDPGHKKPQSVSATCASVTADVSWSAVVDSHLSGYDVYRRASGASEYTKANVVLVTGTSFTVTGLLPSTTYEFRVESVFNDAHLSGMSDAAYCTTA